LSFRLSAKRPLLGSTDALRHGGFRHQKRTGNFRGSQAAYRAQRQGDRGSRGERRMAAHEQQARVSSSPVSVPASTGNASRSASSAATCSRCRRATSLRMWSAFAAMPPVSASHEDSQAHRPAATARLLRSTPLARRPPPPQNPEIFVRPRRTPAARVPATIGRSDAPVFVTSLHHNSGEPRLSVRANQMGPVSGAVNLSALPMLWLPRHP
jgi:hypothetical protein